MSDQRGPLHYDALDETHQKVAEEEEKRKAAEAAALANSPEARLAVMEAELAEKVRLGRITRSEMTYQLRRFDNQIAVEMNVEGAQRARDAEAEAHIKSEHSSDEGAERPMPTGTEKEAEAAGHGSSVEMTDARSARLARLRQITADLTRENDEHGLDYGHEGGDRSP